MPYDVDVVPHFPAQEQFVTAYGDLVVGVYTAATDLLLFAKGEAQKIQLVETDLGHLNDMKTVLDTERRAAKAGVDAAKGRADILDKQLREVQAQLDAVRTKMASERLEFPPGNDLGPVIGAAIVVAAAVSALYTGGATIAAMLVASDMLAKTAASMEGFDTATGKYRDGSYLVNWFDWTSGVPKPRPGIDIKTSQLTDLGDKAAAFINASGTLVQLFQAKVDGKLENEEKNLLVRQLELVRERALQMLEITHQQLNLAVADAKIVVNANDIARLTNLEAGWQRDISQLIDICRRMITRNQHYMDLLTEYCYYANRTVDLWTFSSHTPAFTFDFGYLHPDDIENAYHPLARGDDSRVNGLLEKYQNSKRQLFALMDRRKEYDSYGLNQDVHYLRLTAPEVLNALRTHGTASFTVPLDAFADRFEMKTAYLHVGLLGATCANPRMTVLVEHPGAATNRYRDGSPRTATAGPRSSTVQATFDKNDPGRPMTDQAFYGRSPATTWRITIEPSTAQEAQLDLGGLSAVHVTLWYWHFRRKSPGPAPAPMIVRADFDGDGIVDETVWEPEQGLWHVRRSSDGETLTETWGQAGDFPVPADYDGDGAAELAVFDPSSGKLFTRPLLGSRPMAYHWATADHTLTVEEQPGAERLAAALEACAGQLSGNQRAAEAVDPQQAACLLLRRLTRLDPRHLPQTAQALVRLTHFLAAAGRWEESVTTGREVIALSRRLAADHPQDDALAHRAAEALIGIAGHWWQKPDLQAEAADLALQGTLTVGMLAAKNPSYRPQLAAWATSPTTPFLAHVGRTDEAHLLGTQAITLYRTLAAQNPADDELVYRVSWSSIDVALHLWSKPELQGRATEITVSAIDNLRTLSRRSPSYRRQLAQWAASPAAAFLAQSGRWDEAVAVGDESISLYRALTAENPDDDELAYRLSWASIDIALHLWGKPELQAKATGLTVSAVDNLRTLSTKNPSHRPQLADWIMSPASAFLASTGQRQRAIDLVREAVDLYTQLNTEDPVTYGPKLANAKKTLEQLEA
ncbi:VCBS repeat-containing protein [Streptomyces spectabilis]|uniref:FG-GAP repeat domain-containing protein n=1 Tax=Streptomyces spectabilis TaxID=68270 RepID=UPI0033C703AB